MCYLTFYLVKEATDAFAEVLNSVNSVTIKPVFTSVEPTNVITNPLDVKEPSIERMHESVLEVLLNTQRTTKDVLTNTRDVMNNASDL